MTSDNKNQTDSPQKTKTDKTQSDAPEAKGNKKLNSSKPDKQEIGRTVHPVVSPAITCTYAGPIPFDNDEEVNIFDDNINDLHYEAIPPLPFICDGSDYTLIDLDDIVIAEETCGLDCDDRHNCNDSENQTSCDESAKTDLNKI